MAKQMTSEKAAKTAKAEAGEQKADAGGRKPEGARTGVAYNVTKKRLEDGSGNPVKREQPELEQAKPLDPEVLPKTGSAGDAERFCIVKHAADFSSLERIETSILRDIAVSGKLDKAGAMVGIKIGLALQSAKALLKHGEYEGWVGSKFGEAFSERKAQYFAKLASAFLRSNEGAQLALPAPREAGNWLVVAEDGSQLQSCVEAFVGDLTIGELLDKHGIRPAKAKGGYRPAEWLLKQYQDEHAHLKNKPFDVWPKEERDAFMAWQEKQVAGDDAAARRMAAEATWNNLRLQLNDHGTGRKTYHLIPRKQLEETRDILSSVLREIDKALKEG